MTYILTITPNPAVDLSTSVERIVQFTNFGVPRNGAIPEAAGSTWPASSNA